MKRAVIGARVSVFHEDTKVSHTEQTRTCQAWADSNEHVVVGSFEDLGVSAGKYTPWERPGLGEWLKPERLHEWDSLVFAKMDRAFRSTADCVDLARFAKEHRKILVFVDDGLVLNYRNPQPGMDQMMAELFVYIGAFFAQLELHRFQQRSLDGARAIRFTAKYSGRRPYGFNIVPSPDGKGKVLEHNPDEQDRIHTAAQRVIQGDSFTSVGKDFGWSSTHVKEILTRMSTQGFKIHKDQLVLDPVTREPIRVGPPTFDDTTWQELQAAIKLREYQGKKRVHSTNPLLGIGYCRCVGCQWCMDEVKPPKWPGPWPPESPCGRQLVQRVNYSKRDGVSKGKTYRYAACHDCRGISRKMSEVEEVIGESFLRDYWNREVTTRVFVPGTDNTIELEQVRKSLDRLRAESDAGLVDDESEWLARLDSLTQRKRSLESSPATAAGWVEKGVGKTFLELWSDPETDRAKVLRDAGFRIELWNPPGWPTRIPSQIHISRLGMTEDDRKKARRSSASWEALQTGRHLWSEIQVSEPAMPEPTPDEIEETTARIEAMIATRGKKTV